MKSNSQSGEVTMTDEEKKALMEAVDKDAKVVFKSLLEEGFEYITKEQNAERLEDAINTFRKEQGLHSIKIIDTSEQ